MDANVLSVRVEEVPKTANMTTVTFGSFEPTKIISPIENGPEAKTEVRNLNQERINFKNGLIPYRCKNGEVSMIHPDLVKDMEPSEHHVQKRERKPCHVVEITDTMIIEEEQSLNTRSGRSFEREYSSGTRGLVTPSNQPSVEKSKEGNPLSYDLVDHLARVPAKVSLLDLLKSDKFTRTILVQMLNRMDSPIGRQQAF